MFEYKDKYCEWKYIDVLDTNKQGKACKWSVKTDCGQHIVATRDNKYGLLLKGENTKCPFCNKEIDVRCYE